MSDMDDNLWMCIWDVAEKAVYLYARGILSVEELRQQLMNEWEKREGQPSISGLKRLAQRICSRELYRAWRSSDPDVCNAAFTNLRCYLEQALRQTGYATPLRYYADSVEDVVHQTLELLYLESLKSGHVGPDDPAAFIKWVQTILKRQAHTFLHQCQQEHFPSLDAQPELLAERRRDHESGDPLKYVIIREMWQILEEAILSLHNQHYRQVLLCTYFRGEDEDEIAQHLHIRVQEVYLWRHRALKLLRRNPEVMQVLGSLWEL